MELKEGMYVRDKYEGIGKVTFICKCGECYARGFYEPTIRYANSSDYVRNYIEMQKYEGRASHNIIDLIEVGDYVNGYKVEEVKRGEVELELVGLFGEEFYSETIPVNEIKSIVTKEQFEAMKYEIS